MAELRVALSRYRTMQLVDDTNADYHLKIDTGNLESSSSRIFIELEDARDQSILLAQGYDMDPARQPVRDLGVRIASAVASPGVGAISVHLLATSRLKPVEDLSRAECYANGFGCVKCSGEEDNITRRAEACLANLLERDPNDARAWGLQATIHAHQYLWANTLPEPQRSTPALRRHLPQLAVTPALIAIAERPDLFKSAVHYEPVEDDVFEGDESIAELQSAWFSRWQSFGKALSADDVERAGELLIETVFELPSGGYHQERELHQEVVRQNSRTLPMISKHSPDDPLISCDWLARISVPTHIVGGADTHDYWHRMSRRFSECIPEAGFETIADTRHDGAVDKVDELSTIILDFVDAHRL